GAERGEGCEYRGRGLEALRTLGGVDHVRAEQTGRERGPEHLAVERLDVAIADDEAATLRDAVRPFFGTPQQPRADPDRIAAVRRVERELPRHDALLARAPPRRHAPSMASAARCTARSGANAPSASTRSATSRYSGSRLVASSSRRQA